MKYPIEPPKSRSNASGTITAYAVEARYNYREPKSVGGVIYDNRWREVQFIQSRHGIPANRYSSAAQYGLFDYEQAQALRWWFLAEAAAEHLSLCFETRLVLCTAQYSHTITEVEYIAPQDGRGDVPTDMVQP